MNVSVAFEQGFETVCYYLYTTEKISQATSDFIAIFGMNIIYSVIGILILYALIQNETKFAVRPNDIIL